MKNKVSEKILDTDFVVIRDILQSHFSRHVCYSSITNDHNRFFESKDALKRCKFYAKENGFKRVFVLAKTTRTPDKVYYL